MHPKDPNLKNLFGILEKFKAKIDVGEVFNQPRYCTLNKYQKKFDKFIIKPNESGSSFGIRIIKTKNDLDNLIKNLKNYKKELKYHNSLIIEKYIKGKELTVSVLEIYNKLQSLEVTEILSNNKFFDYKAKYSKGFAKHILPANIPSNIYKRCLRIALRAHKILKCNIISRTDFIYDKKNEFELRLIENDSAWTDDDSIDQDIIKAMKKGNTMKVIGYSTRGTKTTDTYSLMGFTAAYKYISQICDITN